jgi:Ca2+-binding EF-hand superfamily protein
VFKRVKGVLLILAIASMIEGGILVLTLVAQKADNSTPKPQRTLALGEDEVKQLLLLMDTDKNGKISRQEFMGFMAAEFDRLDKDKSGELDVRELAQSQVRPSRPAVGK